MNQTNGRRNGNGKKGGTSAPGILRCGIYTRKSTSAGLEQEFNTLDAQREACESYIRSQAANGWQILEEHYDDGGFTGANVDRPAFQQLLADINAGKIDIVVVYKVDRLSRSLLDFAQVMDQFNRRQVAFVSVTQNFTTTDSIGKLTLNLLMSFSEFEREMIAERTRDKIAAARRRGKWTGGIVPLGYVVVDRKLVIDAVEAVLVREVFDLYLEHRSALVVAQVLNARKRVTKRHRAGNGNLRKARSWDKPSVLRILRNAIFAGYMTTGDELHEGEHKAIVDRETFHRVQALLDSRPKSSRDVQRNPEYILRGVLRCASCGAAMTPASNRRRGKVYRYYRCSTRDKRGADACPTKPLPGDAIEGFVVERIREAILAGNLVEQVTVEMRSRIDARRAELKKVRKGLPAEVKRLRQEAGNLAEKLGSATGAVVGLLADRLDDAGEALASNEELLARVDRSLALLVQAEVDADWVAGALGDFDAVWEVMTLENRGRLVRALVQTVAVDGTTGAVTATLADLQLPAVPEAATTEKEATHG